MIGYSGAAEAKGAGAQFVNVNNVPFGVETIKSGAYPYWSYMHILVAPNAGANVSSIASTLANNVTQLSTATLGGYSYGSVSLSDLTNNVSRQYGVDGGTVTPIWTNQTAFTNLPAW